MSNINDFNPEAWQTPIEKAAEHKEAAPIVSQISASDIANDVDRVLRQLEEKHADITYTHERWVKTGFAFADQFGETGRSLFHRASQFYPGYSQAETDKQYDYCLRSNREGVTIRTFFGYAKEAGVELYTRNLKSPNNPKSPKTPPTTGGGNGDIGEMGETGHVDLPTFSDVVGSDFPEVIQEVAQYGRNPKETDTMVLTALTVISGCLPNVQGCYDDKTVYANLFYFLSARAGAGKGRSELCRRIAAPIHRRLKEAYALLQAAYESNLAKWEATPKRDRGEKPVKPAQTMLYIPADTSATAFVQLLNENGERGIIFETEADGLSKSFESDFGDYSKTFRAAFHHEGAAYHRRGNDEDVEVENPKLSVVLTGTPKQIVRLIGNAENGLFSRFMFYRLESDLTWRSVLGSQSKETLETKFDAIGEKFLEFYDTLCAQPTIYFSTTEEQGRAFDYYFSSLLSDYYRIFQDDIVGSVFRLGLICYRIAMVLTTLRMKETGEFPESLVCSDEDFNTALTISRVLAVHMAKIFDELSLTDGARSANVIKTARQKMFYAALPEEFDRQGYLEVAQQIGVPSSTAEKWIHAFCVEKDPSEKVPLEKVEHGLYRKR